jgi:hypothetical protein
VCHGPQAPGCPCSRSRWVSSGGYLLGPSLPEAAHTSLRGSRFRHRHPAARALAFRLVEGSVLSTSAYYVAAALAWVGGATLVALALTPMSAIVCEASRAADSGCRGELARPVFGGMSGGPHVCGWRRRRQWRSARCEGGRTAGGPIATLLLIPLRLRVCGPGRSLARISRSRGAGDPAEASLMPTARLCCYDPEPLDSPTVSTYPQPRSRGCRGAAPAQERHTTRDPDRRAPVLAPAARGARGRARSQCNPEARRSHWSIGVGRERLVTGG